jgi:hypothetical protein
MFPFLIDFTASSLSSMLVALVGTVSVLLGFFATPR